MIPLRVLSALGCFAILNVLFVHAQEPDLKAILKKAIAAHGGEDALAKAKAVSAKFKGTIEILNNKTDITGENTFLKPDKLKTAVSLEINNMKIDVVTVYDGKKMWVSTNGMTQEVNDEKLLNEMREGLQVEGAGSLADFLKAPYELNALGEVKVKDKEAIGIRISKKGQRDFSLFFDKKTSLILKTEMRAYNAMSGEEVTQEKFIMGYQEKHGMKVAKRVEIVNDGKFFMDFEVTDVQVHEKLGAEVFAKP